MRSARTSGGKASRALWTDRYHGSRRGKANLPAGQTAERQRAGRRSVAQVGEWQAREDGSSGGEGEIPGEVKPRGAANRSRRYTRGRLTNSQRDQSPETGSYATCREFIRRVAQPKTVRGHGPWINRKVCRGCPALIRDATASSDQVRGKSFQG